MTIQVDFDYDAPEAPEIEGSGTASDPWKISSPADWNAVAESINSGAADAVYLSTACYELSADIDFEGQSAVPVSFETGSLVYFGGVFDGKGHTIRNVKTTASGESFGLFGGNEGTIKDLAVENLALSTAFKTAGGVVGTNRGVIDGVTFGGIAGQISKGSDGKGNYIVNCYSWIERVASNNNIGGIVGIVSDDSFVVNCYSTLADVSQNDSFASSVGYNKKGNVQNVYGNEACPSGKKNPDWIVGNDSKQDGSVWAESLGLLLSLDEMKSGAVTVPSSGQECASFTEALNAGAEIYASTPAETLPAKPETAVRKWVDSDSYPVLE